MNDGSLWIGLLLSIPVGIMINIATPAARRSLGHLSNRIRRANRLRDERNQARIELFRQEASNYIAFMIRQTAEIVVQLLIYVMTALLAVGIAALNRSGSKEASDWIVLGVLLLLVLVLSTSVISNLLQLGKVYSSITGQALKVAYRTQNGFKQAVEHAAPAQDSSLGT